MSLNKAIKHGKEKRKPYRRSARFDRTCRPHGGCPWCENGRLYQDRRNRIAADDELDDWVRNGLD